MLAIALVLPAAASADLVSVTKDPPTRRCVPIQPGVYGSTGAYCLLKDRLGNKYLSVSPHLLSVGSVGTITVYSDYHFGFTPQQALPHHETCEGGWAPYTLSCGSDINSPLVRKADDNIPDDSPRLVGAVGIQMLYGEAGADSTGWIPHGSWSDNTLDSYSIHFKVVSVQSEVLNKWVVMQSGYEAEDYFAVVAGSADLTGHVRDHRGRPLAGVTVEGTSAAGQSGQVKTDADGYYSYKGLPYGTWTIKPLTSGKTDRERYDPVSRTLDMSSGGAVTADFTMANGDEVKVSSPEPAGGGFGYQMISGLWWTTAPANGSWSAPMTVQVKNARDDPVKDQVIAVRSFVWEGAGVGGPPRAVLCDDSGRRVYPGEGFERITNADGKITFTVRFGTDAGSYRFTAAEKDDAGKFDLGRVWQRIEGTSPDYKAIRTLLTGKDAPGPAQSAAAVQEGLADFLLGVRARAGTGAPDAGEFGPIRAVKNGKLSGAIVFYPAGNPGPLYAHLNGRAPLPGGYAAVVLPIAQDVITREWGTFRGNPANPLDRGLVGLADWEAAHGPASAGYINPHPDQGSAYFGYPYPPRLDRRGTGDRHPL